MSKTTVLRFSLIAFLALPAQAAPRWLKRAAVAGACAASMLDFGSTVYAVSRGGIEGNPLLAGPHGPHYGRTIGLKVGLCAVQIVAEEFSHNKNADRALIGVAGAQIGVFGWVAHHNNGVNVKP